MALADTLLRSPRRYLRYLHLRKTVRASEPDSVLVIGAGGAVAGVAAAKEFPDIRFHLTDAEFPHRRMERAQRMAEGIENVTFGALDIDKPDLDQKFGLVACIEALQNVAGKDKAAANIRALSSKHVFCLASFANSAAEASSTGEAKESGDDDSGVSGFQPADLEAMFPNPVAKGGAFWVDVLRRFKLESAGLTPKQVKGKAPQLKEIAQGDLRREVPKSATDALGLWILSSVES